MIDVKIDISDVVSKLSSISEQEIIRTIANDIADEAVVPEMAKYPGKSGKKQPPKSAAQRRFIFAAIKRGAIPYQRTGKTGDTTKQPTGAGVDVVSKAGYSDLVRTKASQAPYHRGHWPTVEDLSAKIEGSSAEAIATASVVKILQKAGLT